MNTPDTPTPRTDAFAKHNKPFTWQFCYTGMQGHARQLERELTAAKEEAQVLQTLLKQRDSENAETLAEAVKIEDERNLLRKRAEAAEAGLALIANGQGDPASIATVTLQDIAAYRATEGKK